MDKEDFDISFQERALRIRGEKRCKGEDDGRSYYLSERAYGHFERLISLPHSIDRTQAEVSYQDGVLTVIVPKTADIPPQ